MSEKSYVIEVAKDIYDKISEIKKSTGKSKRFIIAEMLKFAINNKEK